MTLFIRICTLSVLLFSLSCVNSTDNQKTTRESSRFLDLSEVSHYKDDYKVYGKTGKFYTADGKTANFYAQLPVEKNHKALLVFHGKMGLTEDVKREVDRIFQTLDKSMAVLAPDFYDGKIAENEQESNILYDSLKSSRADAIIHSIIGGLQLEASKKGKQPILGSIGWNEGAEWALRAAVKAEDKMHGCVLYYDFPKGKEIDLEEYKAKTIVIKNAATEIPSGLSSNFVIHDFDANAGFANPNHSNFKSKEGNMANHLMLQFFEEIFVNEPVD